MKRRTFTKSAGAALLVPAIPMLESTTKTVDTYKQVCGLWDKVPLGTEVFCREMGATFTLVSKESGNTTFLMWRYINEEGKVSHITTPFWTKV